MDTRLITTEELKTDGFINANFENEYLLPAIDEAQDVWLRETLGDALLEKLEELVEAEQIEGTVYEKLLEGYVKIYLKYKVLSLLCVPVTFKMRNAGIVSQYSGEISTTNLEDTKYLEGYYEQKADFFRNRLTTYLEKNKKDIPEYKWCCRQVTNPDPVHPVCSIYLG